MQTTGGRGRSNRSSKERGNDKESTKTTTTLSCEEITQRSFTSGAVRAADADVTRMDLVCPTGLLRLAAIYKEGADKYGDTNWCRGIPVSVMLNHLETHLQRWKKGDRTEDHLAKIAWGVFSIMHYEERCKHHDVILLNRDIDDKYLLSQKFDFLQGDPHQ